MPRRHPKRVIKEYPYHYSDCDCRAEESCMEPVLVNGRGIEYQGKCEHTDWRCINPDCAKLICACCFENQSEWGACPICDHKQKTPDD